MSTEFLTIYWRDMLRFVRFRIVLVASLIQPALWMALYGAAMSNNFSRLGSGMVVPDGRRRRLLSYLHGSGSDCSDHALHQPLRRHHSPIRQELGTDERAVSQPHAPKPHHCGHRSLRRHQILHSGYGHHGIWPAHRRSILPGIHTAPYCGRNLRSAALCGHILPGLSVPLLGHLHEHGDTRRACRRSSLS